MQAAIILIEFVLDQIPTVIHHCLGIINKQSRGRTENNNPERFDESDSSDSLETLSDMGEDDSAIWFDGVDKKLIDIHTRSKEDVVEITGRGDLLTKTPLISYKAIVRRRKQKLEQNGQSGTSSNGAEIGLKDKIKPTTGLTDELAIDCEMVECNGYKSVLARVSVVNLFGHPLLDSYVAPPSKVTDYRTRYSGIRKRDIEHAPSFDEVQVKVADLIRNRIIVGHAVHNDFDVLKLKHPSEYIRDTSKYFGRHYFMGKMPSLKKLSESILGVKIQQGEHDSVQDAQATMKLYVTVREKWEEMMLKKGGLSGAAGSSNHRHQNNQKTKKKKLKRNKIKTFYVETLQ